MNTQDERETYDRMHKIACIVTDISYLDRSISSASEHRHPDHFHGSPSYVITARVKIIMCNGAVCIEIPIILVTATSCSLVPCLPLD
jgi:hypothetical protein